MKHLSKKIQIIPRTKTLQKITLNPRSKLSQSMRDLTQFYKPQQMRFRQFKRNSLNRSPLRHQVSISSDPWLLMKDQQVRELIDRLQDRPQQLYSTIQAKQRKLKNKFKLLKVDSYKQNKSQVGVQKQNRSIIRLIESRKKKYEQQLIGIIKQPKVNGINIVLPKVQDVRYIFNDNLHKLSKINNKK